MFTPQNVPLCERSVDHDSSSGAIRDDVSMYALTDYSASKTLYTECYSDNYM